VARIYAGILAPLALVVTVARGLIHNGSLVESLWTGCGWMALFAVVGVAVGWIADRTIEESVARGLLAEMSAREAADAQTATAVTPK
jgi:uncharacterized membrane protein (DUF441 family)